MTNASTTSAVIRSEDQLPLRFYAHPLKLTLLFLIMASACAIFIWLHFNPNVVGGIAPVAFLSALLFGYGAIAYLTMIILFVIKRRPLLDIDANGCTYSLPFTFGERFLPWDNIASISLATRRVQRSFYTSAISSFTLNAPKSFPTRREKRSFAVSCLSRRTEARPSPSAISSSGPQAPISRICSSESFVWPRISTTRPPPDSVRRYPAQCLLYQTGMLRRVFRRPPCAHPAGAAARDVRATESSKSDALTWPFRGRRGKRPG